MVNISNLASIIETVTDVAVDCCSMVEEKRNAGSNNKSTSDDDLAEAELDDGANIPLSTCTGNKKALFIGINYFGQNGELRGCINDVKNIKNFVTTNFNFPTDSDHMRTLTDDDTNNMPTRANILSGMKWLVNGAKSGDSLFLHYSGHGGSQKAAQSGTEADGKDETLIPVDYQTAGQIIDDDLYDTLVAGLPQGVRLTCIMDCCHSGSILDLPYTYGVDASGNISEKDNRKALIKQAMKAGLLLASGQKVAAVMAGAQAVQMHFENRKNKNSNNSSGNTGGITVKNALADVIQFSGCRDDQTSADASIGGESTGAMSWALVTCFQKYGSNQTYVQLLQNMRKVLSGKYTQIPQMSTGHRMNMNTTFKM
jgi:metacaspase-1